MKIIYQPKTITKFIYLFLLSIMFYACSKDKCPDNPSYTYKYYEISESVKQTFPYHFKDTQVWINVNTNDTLHYILKDTMSSYDTTSSIFESGCPTYNIVYNEMITYKFNCIEDTLYNYNHSYLSDIRQYLFFKQKSYYTYIGTHDTIVNYSKVFKEVRDRKYFWENYENGVVRITISNTKLYRIK